MTDPKQLHEAEVDAFFALQPTLIVRRTTPRWRHWLMFSVAVLLSAAMWLLIGAGILWIVRELS